MYLHTKEEMSVKTNLKVSHRLVLGPYKVQKEVKSTQKQPSYEKMVRP